jgi:LysM repeat protein
VQSGDTLLTIALAFETSTEALQELNGIVNPRFLQIGQELIIPASNVAAETPPTPTATPLPLGNPKILSNQ